MMAVENPELGKVAEEVTENLKSAIASL
jgi:hypothetical protein